MSVTFPPPECEKSALQRDRLRMTSSCSDHNHVYSHQIRSILPHHQPPHLASPHLTSNRTTSQPTTSHHNASHHITPPPKYQRQTEKLLVRNENSVWAAQWLVALRTFYRQIISLAYRFFPLKLPPGSPGNWQNINMNYSVSRDLGVIQKPI